MYTCIHIYIYTHIRIYIYTYGPFGRVMAQSGSVRFRVRFRPVQELTGPVRFASASSVRFLIPSCVLCVESLVCMRSEGMTGTFGKGPIAPGRA